MTEKLNLGHQFISALGIIYPFKAYNSRFGIISIMLLLETCIYMFVYSGIICNAYALPDSLQYYHKYWCWDDCLGALKAQLFTIYSYTLL